jgi:hypothetical protein
MTKTSKTSADSLHKELVRRERRIYLEGRDKSHTWDEVKEMAHGKGRLPGMTVDQEIELYLPLLNAQQKRIVLALVKAFVSKQNSYRESLYKEQREGVKTISAVKKTNRR